MVAGMRVQALFDLTGRAAVVTGGGTHLGRAMAEALGELGAAVYLVVNALITDPKWTSITFAVVLAGLPVYHVWFSGRVRPSSLEHSRL